MGRHASGERRSRLAAAADGEVTGARADLHILLHTRRLQWLSILAIVVIFAVYFAVLAVLGHEHDWLLLLIIPAGLAGVSIGALLDYAHRDSANDAAAGGDARSEEPEVAEQAEEPELAGRLEHEGESEA
jgi:hypothetical protein